MAYNPPVAGEDPWDSKLLETLTYLKTTSETALSQSGGALSGRSGAVTVASSEASAAAKASADFVCTGTNDQTVINQALARASRIADGFTGGQGQIAVELVGPNFYVGQNNTTPITMYPNTVLRGQHQGTLIQPNYGATWGTNGRGVIELLNNTVSNVTVRDLTIAKVNTTRWNGIGIMWSQTGQGSAYDLPSGNDPHLRVQHVRVAFSNQAGFYATGTTGGARGSEYSYCEAWNCLGEGFFSDNSSDTKISNCVANGGGNAARFRLSGGNADIANCKAFYSGNDSSAAGTGFLFDGSRVNASACIAQDCGGWGFVVSGVDATVTGCIADSNSREGVSTTMGGFQINSRGAYTGLHAYDRGQTPLSPQTRGVVLVGSPQAFISGRVSVPSGTSEVVGAAGTGSYVRVVRDGSTVYSVG